MREGLRSEDSSPFFEAFRLWDQARQFAEPALGDVEVGFVKWQVARVLSMKREGQECLVPRRRAPIAPAARGCVFLARGGLHVLRVAWELEIPCSPTMVCPLRLGVLVSGPRGHGCLASTVALWGQVAGPMG